MKPGRKPKVAHVPTYKVLVYVPHKSGIGHTLVKEELVTTKPTFETHWFDSTNQCWARTISEYRKSYM